MNGQYVGGYNVDIVMCIDGTGSMSPIIEEVKRNALSFHGRFVETMEENGKQVGQLRVKVIVFRDFICDSEPMTESPFFDLPSENTAFQSFVDRIEACGGGDTPENALEAIALALKSRWTTGGSRRRHCVLVFSDAPALALGERADCPNYPAGLPKTLAGLGDWWTGADQYFSGTYQPKAGRLVAFVPKSESWTRLETWARYWPVYSSAGTGLPEVDIQSVLELMVGSF